jgi:two-component system chemotaxis sensor kinase CheA
MQDPEIIQEFLVESSDNLGRLDRELVELEKSPRDAELLASIFRTFHTIKGTCGFLGFSRLEAIAHLAEDILSQLRDGRRTLTPELVSLILETVDATRRILAAIEKTGEEGPEGFEALVERLRRAAAGVETAPAAPGPTASVEEVEEALARSSVADATIRVGVGLLDKLMDLVGELVLARNQILQYTAEREDAALNATSQRLNLITTELQEGVMKTRMQPIGTVWNKLPRVVRDMAVSLGKQIALEMDGAETELDRTIIEAIKDPLVHLVRNACDHGIEPPEARLKAGKPAQGRLSLRAYHEGGQVNIEIADDGAGIDPARIRRAAVERGLMRPDQADKLSDREALNLIFAPGFSTAQSVTSVSGRGVGMDVVKSHVERIGGVVDVMSRPGEGTTVKLKIPLTLAIIPGLVIHSGGERFVIPQVSLLELIRLEAETAHNQIESVHGTPVYRRRGSLLPIAYLNQVLGLEPEAEGDAVYIVVLQAEDRQFGLVVDGIHDTQEIVVKPLGKQFKGLNVYAGATIMGDGRIALILDVLGIGQRSGVLSEAREQARAVAEKKMQAAEERQRLLLFRAGRFERLAVPLSLVARLEEFPREALETAGGRRVVQYRDQILPLVRLEVVLEGGAAGELPETVPVIVFRDGERSLGLVVDQILDIAEETVTVRRKTDRRGLLGSAVVGKRVTDFLDLNYLLSLPEAGWFDTGAHGRACRVLLVEPSTFARGLIRAELEMAGYGVLEAASRQEALELLERAPVEVVLASLELEPEGLAPLVAALRKRPEWAGIPVVALAGSAERAARVPEGVAGCHAKFDRAAMLASIDRLSAAVTGLTLAPADAGVGR